MHKTWFAFIAFVLVIASYGQGTITVRKIAAVPTVSVCGKVYGKVNNREVFHCGLVVNDTSMLKVVGYKLIARSPANTMLVEFNVKGNYPAPAPSLPKRFPRGTRLIYEEIEVVNVLADKKMRSPTLIFVVE